ncbi:MAG: hypothetical protein LWW88_15210 [Acinetobacter sp.]|mgnify:FL=1|uniref:Uncharacterized protein n=1 Tax=Acinetobacter modestus TaxID=1776740 RepID=A0ABP2TUH2_9GAMM|nr:MULTISPECIES: hypothetical protein [Acinetobacter]ENU25932.1 hypothetical protein F992_02801 [Acinetobacter modestus]MCE1272872.1 hypothetical protein [Acinetobacter sp.]MCH7387831.1 hypothetical protein [Acinetobacter modestus]MCM1960571.1 hypothetical protein [Acinetobacter modestus]GGA27744.1 hypothetical protein GCM10017554_26050 [Acinetobacter modestus]
MDQQHKSELEKMAQQLHRPVMSFKDFKHVSEQDMNWLNQQLQRTIQLENQRINKSLFQMPFFLRFLFKNKK